MSRNVWTLVARLQRQTIARSYRFHEKSIDFIRPITQLYHNDVVIGSTSATAFVFPDTNDMPVHVVSNNNSLKLSQ